MGTHGWLLACLLVGCQIAKASDGRSLIHEPAATSPCPSADPLVGKASLDAQVTFRIPAPPPPPEAIGSDEADILLRAIAEVESLGNPTKVGNRGERGLYQFRPRVWRQYTRAAFRRAHDPSLSTEIARRHYLWIRSQLKAAGVRDSAFEIALVWNAGLTSVLTGRVASSAYEYAERVNNISSILRRTKS